MSAEGDPPLKNNASVGSEAAAILRRLEPALTQQTRATADLALEFNHIRREVTGFRGEIWGVRGDSAIVRNDVERFSTELAKVNARLDLQIEALAKLREDVAELKGFAAAGPTILQLLLGAFGIITALFAILRFAGLFAR